MNIHIKQIQNQSGFLSIDFLFGIILVMGLSAILLAFSFTLSVVEGMQYIAFASSRAAFASHKTQSDQEALGMAKYTQLLKTPGLASLMKKEWFSMHGVINDYSQDYEAESGFAKKFYGMVINIQVRYLDFSIPLYGSTAGGNGFPARVTAFLGRESSAEECTEFMKKRWEWISYGTQLGTAGGDKIEPGDDNGC